MNRIAKLEFDGLSDLQKEIHGFDCEGNTMIKSSFHRGYKNTTWSSQYSKRLKLNASTQKDGFTEAEFIADSTFDWLAYVYKIDSYPAIKVKKGHEDKVRIRFCHNLGTNNVLDAKLRINNTVEGGSYDRTWSDIEPQYFTEPGFREHYNKVIGNVPHVEDWTTFLPARTNKVILQFSHCKYRDDGVPLFFFTGTDSATYHFKFVNNVSGLLQMQVLKYRVTKDAAGKDEKIPVWVDIPVKYDFLEGVTASTILPFPEIWGRYFTMDPTEKNINMEMTIQRNIFTKGDDDDENFSTDGVYEMYIDDVVVCDAPGAKTYGETVEISLTSKDTAKAIFIVAENARARNNRNLSNYTTNAEDLKKGYNPISRIIFSHSGENKVDLDCSHTEDIEPFKHFKSAPEYAGYHAIALCPEVLHLPETGIVLEGKSAKITVTLGNQDPYLIPLTSGTSADNDDVFSDIYEESDEKKPSQLSKDSFIVRVRVLVQRKITVRRQENGKFTFSSA